MDLFDGLLGPILTIWVICGVIVGVLARLHVNDGGVKGEPRDNLLIIAAGPIALLVFIALIIYLATQDRLDGDDEA